MRSYFRLPVKYKTRARAQRSWPARFFKAACTLKSRVRHDNKKVRLIAKRNYIYLTQFFTVFYWNRFSKRRQYLLRKIGTNFKDGNFQQHCSFTEDSSQIVSVSIGGHRLDQSLADSSQSLIGLSQDPLNNFG